MDKKELKMYVTPAQEIIKLETESHILAGSGKIGGGGKWHSDLDDELDLEEEE